MSDAKWCWMFPGDDCSHGPFLTRERALIAARVRIGEPGGPVPGDSIWIGHVEHVTPSSHIHPDMNEIVEAMNDDVEEAYDIMACSFVPKPGAEEALLISQRAWADTWLKSDSWRMSDDHEEVKL